MSVSEETFYAFLDGTLAAEERERVAALIAGDRTLAVRLANQQVLAAAARASFSADLEQPIPPGWLEAIDSADLEPSASVASLDVWRARRANRWTGWHVGFAAAASLALGLYVQGPERSGSLIDDRDGVLLASASLHEALDIARSGVPLQVDDDRAIDVQLSMRSAAGDYCREALVSAGAKASHHLLACRGGSGWQVVGLAPTAPAEAGYATASGDTPFDPLITSMGGEILDGEGERLAIIAGWKRPD